MKFIKPPLILAVLVILSGCSTPQVALDQANNGVSLIQKLQNELQRYKTSSKLSSERRLGIIDQLDTSTSNTALIHSMEQYRLSKAGLSDVLAARDRLRDDSDTLAKQIADRKKAQQDRATRLADLVKGLPTPTEKLGEAQKAMAELGTELSASERVAIVTKFLEQAKCIAEQGAKSSTGGGKATPPTPAASAAPKAAAAATTPASAPAAAPASACTSSSDKKD